MAKRAPAAKPKPADKSKAPPPARPLPPQPADPGEQGTERQLRHDEKLKRKGYRFVKEQADRVCDFFEKSLKHSKGRRFAGKYFVLEPWQRGYLRRLFGWFAPDGLRRYTRTSAWIPRKNGKSTLAAGIALYLAFADCEPGAEVYCAASNAKQARIVFEEAKRMAMAADELAEAVEPFKDSLFMPALGAKLEAIASKPNSQHGFNPHAAIIDEVHAIKDPELYEVLTSGSGARDMPMEVVISTAGHDRTSIGWEIWDYACKVRDGIIHDPEYLPLIFAADPEDDWRSEATWRKANPNLGVSITLKSFKRDFNKAANQPSRENAFRRLHLNQWTEQATRWMSMDKWDACSTKLPKNLDGSECWLGMDLSKRTDLTALNAVFRRGDEYSTLAYHFLPEDEIRDREKRDGVPYRLWAKQGYITLTPGNVIDYAFIRTRVLDLAQRYQVLELAHDPHGSTQLAIQLRDDGINCFDFKQDIRTMNEPTKLLEALVLTGKLRHGGNPVLRWMASNAVVIEDSTGNLKLAKNKSNGRIDGLVALVMALARGTLAEDRTSVYKKRGLTVV